MPFDTFNDRLRAAATAALAHCRTRYGSNGLKIEQGIDASIGWRPTFHLKPSKFRILAVEVEDLLYPEGLKGAAYEIGHYDFPIAVYQVCTLEAYLADVKQERVNKMKKHGFGIITVDEDGAVVVQHHCIPLMQFIAPDLFEGEISGLIQSLKVAFKEAYETYATNEGQGLQLAGQIVEALVNSIAQIAVKRGVISIGSALPLAGVIDRLYATSVFEPYRAALGGAREFIREFRNISSHAPKTAVQASEKIRKCRTGFLDSIMVCKNLQKVARSLGYTIRINL